MDAIMLRRKALFGAALKIEGKTAEQWASEQPNEKTGDVGISTPHLYLVLGGRTTSGPLTARIDDLIAKHFGALLSEPDSEPADDSTEATEATEAEVL